MFMAKVVGTVVPAVTVEGLEGIRLLLLRPENSDGSVAGKIIVACDATLTAGIGTIVTVVDGREATLPFDNTFIPADATVVGIIDRVNISGAGE
jgi:ethanolamine utilization protein EutN